MTVGRGLTGFRKQCFALAIAERMKRFNRCECLVQNLHAVNARDNDGGGKIQGVVQTLNRCHGPSTSTKCRSPCSSFPTRLFAASLTQVEPAFRNCGNARP